MPQGWKVKKLGEVGKIVSGGTPSTANLYYWNGNIPWITPADLSGYESKQIEKGRKSITELGLQNSSARLIPKGSVLFSSRAPIGYVAIAANEVCTNQGFKSVAPDKNTSSDYLYYFLKASKDKAEKAASGTTFKEISLKSFSDLQIPLPPLPEQHRIVAKIEALFSQLDNGIAQLKTAQAQLKVYRQAVLKWAFEGRLTNADVQDGELPEGWRQKQLMSLAKLINGDRGKNYPNRTEYVTQGIPFINTGHIESNGKLDLDSMNYISREKFTTLNSGKVRMGDLIYCLRGATMGKTAIISQVDEGAVASSLVIIRVNDEISNLYLYHFLMSPIGKENIRKYDNGSAQPNLSAKSLSMYTIPVPSLPEQHRIVQQIESRLSVCDKLEETITQALQQSEALRQSILKRAFEGRLVK